jgi:hypothetical protein
MYLMSASRKCALSSLRIQRPTSLRMGFPLASRVCSPDARMSCGAMTKVSFQVSAAAV